MTAPGRGPQGRVGLVGCVRQQGAGKAAARDLFVSPLFRARRAYVERTCGRWYVLSALHGLVAPGEELAPYDLKLKSLSQAERRAWSERVLTQLEAELGAVDGLTFEIHAGASYTNEGLVRGLRSRGAVVELPAAGLGEAQELAFYHESNKAAPGAAASADAAGEDVGDEAAEAARAALQAAEAAAVAARPPQEVDGKPSMTAEVGDLTSARPEPPKRAPDRAAVLKAVVDPLDEDFEPPAHKSARASGAELDASLDKRGPGSRSLAGPDDERVADASMLVDERRVGDEHETVRAQSFAQAAAFITSASSGTWDAPEMAAGMLTVEQVRKAGRFAWDEFMNLYLPHVGFVAAVLKAAPSANGAPGDVSFVPRSEQDVRPVGWHHLIDCGCAHCESRGAAS